MNTREKIEEFSLEWGNVFPDGWLWTDLFPLIEKIVTAKGGYFIFKIDGERASNKYTFSVNMPFPVDVIIRKDTDDCEHGAYYLVEELIANRLLP